MIARSMIRRCRQTTQGVIRAPWVLRRAIYLDLRTLYTSSNNVIEWKHLERQANARSASKRERGLRHAFEKQGDPIYATPIEEIAEAIYNIEQDESVPQVKPVSQRSEDSRRKVDFAAAFRWVRGQPEDTKSTRVHWVKRIVIEFLTSREAGYQFVAAIDEFLDVIDPWRESRDVKFGRELGPTLSDNLRLYNAIASRLQRLQVPLSKNMLFWGVYFAAEARSAAAMHSYLQGYPEDQKGDPEYRKGDPRASLLLRSLGRWISNDSFEGWEGLQRKKQLLTVLCGWSENGVRGHDDTRQACIRDLVASSGPTYLSMLQRLSGADAIFDEWVYFQQTALWQMATSGKYTNRMQNAMPVVEAFIQNLVAANDPKRAWQVLQESRCKPSNLGDSTWDSLLEYPEYLMGAQDGMSGHVLRKYDEHLRRIEGVLGVQWSGGEDGFHVVMAPIVHDDTSKGAAG